jgi:hypothetical protein
MAGEPKIRGKINAVLHGLVREGVISRFRLDFGDDDALSDPIVTVAVSEGQSLEDVRMSVIDALAAVAIGIDVTAERA